MRIKEGVAQMERVNGDLTKSDEETANVLNDFFTSVYTKEPDEVLPEFEDKLDEIGHVTDVNITEEKVRSKLKQLKENKSPGPDSTHPRVLKECCDECAKPLCLLFRKSLDERNLPLDWKEANVTTIHKKGKKTSPKKYHPVSLKGIPCKILENLIKELIQEHLDKHSLNNMKQHGFIKGRSCLTNLLETLDDITTSIDEGIDVDVISLDFSKAFDFVPHRRQLQKLSAFGVKGKYCHGLQTF